MYLKIFKRKKFKKICEQLLWKYATTCSSLTGAGKIAALLIVAATRKGGDGLKEKYNFTYVWNGTGLKTVNWRYWTFGFVQEVGDLPPQQKKNTNI